MELAELGEIGEAGEIALGEEAEIAEFGGAATEEGLAIENTAAFNKNLPRLRFLPESGNNPEIGILEKGKTTIFSKSLLRII